VLLVALKETSTTAVFSVPVERFQQWYGFSERTAERGYGDRDVLDSGPDATPPTITVAPNPHWVEFSPDGTRAWTANHESNLVTVFDTTTRQEIKRIDTAPPGSNLGGAPHSIAVHPTDDLVAGVNYAGSSVSFYDTQANSLIEVVPVPAPPGLGDRPPEPQDLAWAPDGRHLYVINSGNDTVSVMDTATRRVVATIPMPADPTSIAVLPNGRKGYVTNLTDGTVTVLNLAAN
jgi:YVTN family beta-propeller protein